MKKIFVFFGFLIVLLNSSLSHATLKQVDTKDILSLIDQSKGKILILMFWSMWCPLCIEELKVLKKIKKEYKGLNVVSVCLDNNPGKVAEFLRRKSINLPVFLGREDVKINFNIIAVPKMYIFDRKNNVVKRQIGYIEEDALIEIITHLTQSVR